MTVERARILQVSRSVIRGGFDYHAEIARGFVERGAEVHTVFLRGRMPREKGPGFPGAVTCLEADRRRALKKDLLFALALWQVSGRRRQHLAVCHHLAPARAAQILLRLGQIDAGVMIVHDHDYCDPLDKHGARRKRVVERLMRHPWRVVGVSQAICNNLRAQVPAIPPERCRVIHNAIDIETLEQRMLTRDEARRALGLDAGDFVFGTIGRLVAFKAHDELIDAFARTRAAMPRARLIIIGRGPLESRLRDRVESAGLGDRVILHGFLDDAARYVRAFDAFVFPSHHEPFGLVLLEAMAGSVPVVASDSGATGEILPTKEALYPTGNRVVLGQRMLDLYGMPGAERERLGRAGYLHARRNFSLERYRGAYADLLDPGPGQVAGV